MNMKLKNVKASFILNQNLIEKNSGTEKFMFKEQSINIHHTVVKSITQLMKCWEEMMKRINEKIILKMGDNLGNPSKKKGGKQAGLSWAKLKLS